MNSFITRITSEWVIILENPFSCDRTFPRTTLEMLLTFSIIKESCCSLKRFFCASVNVCTLACNTSLKKYIKMQINAMELSPIPIANCAPLMEKLKRSRMPVDTISTARIIFFRCDTSAGMLTMGLQWINCLILLIISSSL